MGRLIDTDSLKGCAIIRPTSHETIEHIKQCGNDVINHNDIPTAYDVEKVVEELEELANYNGNAYLDSADVIDIVKRGGKQ